MQYALNDFHSIKDAFINLRCRDHFNIPKLHSLRHYVKSIRNFGSLDGLNTEHSKRLHINYAKKAYAASSRKDYVIQMTKWLQRQEAIMWFKAYLTWHNGHLRRDSTSSDSDSESDNPDCPAITQSVRSAPTLTQIFSTGQHYHISWQPQFSGKTVEYLERHHGAISFLDALWAFLNTLPYRRKYFVPNANDRFDVFSNLTILVQPSEHMPNKNFARIRSHPWCSNGPHKPPTPARFDTVLVPVDSELRQHGGFHGKLSLIYD